VSVENQIAVVTGASRGLGRAIALRLARAGARIAACARDGEALAALGREIEAGGGQFVPGQVDIVHYGQIEAWLDTVRQRFGGGVDILINNAGVGWHKPFLERAIEEIDMELDVNLKAVVYMCRAVLPDMLARGAGQIVTIASDLSRRPLANMAPYVAAKHGALGFSHSLLREVKDQGVKVMTLNPGIIDTYFGGGEAGTREETWALRPEALADIVLNMLSQPRYVAIDEMAVHPLHQDF